jgi:hypothetical protein
MTAAPPCKNSGSRVVSGVSPAPFAIGVNVYVVNGLTRSTVFPLLAAGGNSCRLKRPKFPGRDPWQSWHRQENKGFG